MLRPSMRMSRILLIGALIGSLLLPAPALAGTRAERNRAKLYGWVNAYRVDHGRKALSDNANLSTFAWNHSKRMAQARTLFHSSTLDTKARSFGATAWGENIGVGSSLWSVFAAWKRSAPHRVNMLNGKFRRGGIGVVYTHGRFWITLDMYG